MDMDLFLLNKLSQLKDGNTGGGGAAGGYLISPKDSTTTNYDVGRTPFYTVYANNARYAYDSQEWAGSNNQGNFSCATQYGASDRRAIFFAAREEMDRSRNDKYYNACMEGRSQHQSSQRLYGSVRYHSGIGTMRHQSRYHDNYGSFGARIVFLRNPTSSNINANMYYQFSSRYSNSHDGSSLVEYTPNNTAYSQVTAVSHTAKWSYTSSTWHGNNNVSITIEPNQTRAYVLCNTHQYWTSTSNGYLIWETNGFYNTHHLTNAGLVCDLKATQHYLCNRQANYNGNDGSDADLVTFWKSLGEAFGDNS